MSILNWQVNSPSNFAPFFIVMTYNSLANFKLMYFLLWIPSKSQFRDFRVLWWKFAKFLMSFSKLQVTFFQILHHSPVSWKITSLYFFNSNIIYSGHKQPIKAQIFETFECSSQSSSNSLCQFWSDKSISFQIFHHSSLSSHTTPLQFSARAFSILDKRIPSKS